MAENTAKQKVSTNSQDFLHRLRTVPTRTFGEGWKTRQSLLRGAGLVKAATASAVSRRQAPNTESVPLWNKGLKPPGKGSKPCFPQRQMRTHS